MKRDQTNKKFVWITFLLVFGLSLALALALNLTNPAQVQAAPAPQQPALVSSAYAGSGACAGCHKDVHDAWSGTLHSQAYSSPIFQEDWAKQGTNNSCLECHTTGYDPNTGKFSEEGVTCESCHGPFQEGHPEKPMPVTPDASLCGRCHKTTTDEWKASKHGQMGINCQSCHNPHSQQPKAASITELCANCHKDTGSSFTHGTHSNAGLKCSDCHMATASHTSSTGGLFATGHTFTVGSDACINCHKDTVHTRDTIIKLSGGDTAQKAATLEELQQKVQANEQTIQNLETQSNVRLYTGLIQGAIVGLITGGAAAWIVSRRIRIVEVDEDGQ
jgi:predicted CXXCH cytochrome family protein